MKKSFLILLFVLTVLSSWGQAVGEWQDHNSFMTVRQVCSTTDRVYAASRMAMFYLDKQDSSLTRLTKVDGLSDVGISTFAYNKEYDCLVVAYTNSGFDLVFGNQVYPVADIRYSTISGDKMIYHIRFNGRYAYLATGFGLVVVDMPRHEIEATYYLGEDGGNGMVYDVAFTDSLVVVGTDRGFLYAPKDSPRLHIYDVWTLDTVSPLRNMSVRMLDVADGRLVAAACTDNPDNLTTFYQQSDGAWVEWNTGHLTSMSCCGSRVILNRYDQIEVYSRPGLLEQVMTDLPPYGMSAFDADIDPDGTLWLGHSWTGLVCLSPVGSTPSAYCPDGPANDDYVYGLTTTYDRLYLCQGGKKPTYESAYLSGRISVLQKGQWHQISSADNVPFHQDVLHLVVDPRDSRHLSATAWGYGVLDIYNDEVCTLYDGDNTSGALTPYISDNFRHLRVSGLAYDNRGDLWVTNSLVPHGLAVRHHNGEWESFDISTMFQGISEEKKEIDHVVWDSVTDNKWIIGRGNRIYAHNGKDKMAFVNPNNGSKLETHAVTCLVQDRSGDIWFGTDKGLKVIYDGYRVFNNGGRGEQAPCACSNILYNADGINEYLMAYESITCIAVDGANRKWVGTANNGLYLISANGLEQIHHFTTANSPLNSDKILTLAVHPVTGVLYVGTNMGLQSYRSTATYAENYPSTDIHAFPNPVRPGYDGPIAIKGFTRDALVHITDARGHVVYSTTANGGQAMWNGCTLSGEPVASGPYFVFASDQTGGMRSVTKILIIR